MCGYAGKVLEVNLTTGDITTSEPDEKDCRDYPGGSGPGAKIYHKHHVHGRTGMGAVMGSMFSLSVTTRRERPGGARG